MANNIRLLSWNVNGIRAVYKKAFLPWLQAESPDILCVQETKAQKEQAPPDLAQPAGYNANWNSAEKKGYSGVATFSKQNPVKVQNGMNTPELDHEGRIVETEFKDFILFNVYFPNGKRNDRLIYKLKFYDKFLNRIDKLKNKGKNIIFCGDVNTAHNEIDLAHPKENSKTSGFLPEERAWLDKVIAHGYIDTFRHLHKEPEQYTWWDYKTRARERNTGWRLDYFFISDSLKNNLKKAFILNEVMGSDHCPVGIELAL